MSGSKIPSLVWCIKLQRVVRESIWSRSDHAHLYFSACYLQQEACSVHIVFPRSSVPPHPLTYSVTSSFVGLAICSLRILCNPSISWRVNMPYIHAASYSTAHSIYRLKGVKSAAIETFIHHFFLTSIPFPHYRLIVPLSFPLLLCYQKSMEWFQLKENAWSAVKKINNV